MHEKSAKVKKQYSVFEFFTCLILKTLDWLSYLLSTFCLKIIVTFIKQMKIEKKLEQWKESVLTNFNKCLIT